jgi:3' terminal RNA ribose 2'-O-methyltransferase Hen1
MLANIASDFAETIRQDMLLTITTTHRPASDLGFLLHKHPGRRQSFPLSFGVAHVFYPVLSDERCTAVLQVDVDPIRLVRRGAGGGFALAQYVNDRPYAASSFLSVAIAEVFGSALAGRSRERPELTDAALPLEARISVLRCRDGMLVIRTLFEPLGFDRIEIEPLPLDEAQPEWGASPYIRLTLGVTARLQDVLRQLTVLIPVIDDDKHYWIGADELDKLMRRGEGWLDRHPARAFIIDRYLRYRRTLIGEANERLSALEDDSGEEPPDCDANETDLPPMNLHNQRLDAVAAVLRAGGARRVLDLGCGEGRLIERLLARRQFTEIVGVDVSAITLARASRRLHLDQSPARERVRLLQGALTYRDSRLAGFDAAALIEVIEHLEPARLPAFERAVFGEARPGMIVLTTPNREWNGVFEDAATMRHSDHRFEWTREEFASWARATAERFGYAARFDGVGPDHPDFGPPTQLAIFTLSPSDGNSRHDV